MVGLLIGMGLIALVVLVVYISGYYTIRSIGKPSVLLTIFIFFVTSAALEEIVFRGIVYRIIETTWGTKSALVTSALLFGAAHILNDHVDFISIISAASGGVFLGLLYSLKGRLWLPLAFHASWNWTQAAFGTVVSGNTDLPTFLDVNLTGPELITGGAFGMENSIITVGLIIFSSGLVISILIKKHQAF